MKKFSMSELLEPITLVKPINISEVYQYLLSSGAENLMWYENVSVMAHIANVALFAEQIANKVRQNGVNIDAQKVSVLAWLRDIGRVSWAIAEKEEYKEIISDYGHHGLLGYKLLKRSGVNDSYASICMTHIGSGVTAQEVEKINSIFGKNIFPVQDWYAKTLEEMVVVIADKIPGWNNTILKPWLTNQEQDDEGAEASRRKGNKIYSWIPNQTPLWERFWGFKKKVDMAFGLGRFTLFCKRLF